MYGDPTFLETEHEAVMRKIHQEAIASKDAEIERLRTALMDIVRLGKTTGYGRAALGTIARRALSNVS